MQASEFLAEFFGPRSSAQVCVCSLSNERGKAEPKQIYTRDPDKVDRFSKQWDQAGRGMFFGVATYPKGKTRLKANIAEIICLHCDLDFKGIDATRAEIETVLARLRLPPSLVVFSGHGLHGYWLFKQATTDVARVERLLKLLAWALAGDEAVAEVARIMRLPGSHNSKFGEWAEVEVVYRNAVDYTLDELETWLEGMREPLLPRHDKQQKPTPRTGARTPFERVAAEEIIPERMDIDELWDDLQYFGTGAGGNVHDTQVRIGAALLSRGEPVENTIAYIREQLELRITECVSWDWAQEIQNIQGQCLSWFTKHPELLEKQEHKPDWLLRDERIKKLLNGGGPKLAEELRVQMAAPQVKLKTEAPQPDPVVIEYITAPQLEKHPVEQAEFLVPGLIIADALNGFFGDGGVGKDLFLLQLGHAMTCNRKFLGYKVPQGRVLIFNVEDNIREMRWRQHKIMKNLEIIQSSDDLWIVPMLGKDTILASFNSKTGLVQPTPLYNAVYKLIDEFKPLLVIVGNRVNIFAVNQIDDAQARQCLGLLNKIIIECNTTVIMPAHPSLGQIASGEGSSGSVQWSNGCRQRIYFSRPAAKKKKDGEPVDINERDERVLEVLKSNWGPTGEGLQLFWDNWSFRLSNVVEVHGSATEKSEAEQEIEGADDHEFLKMLDLFTKDKEYVSIDRQAHTFAPTMFSGDDRCSLRGEKGKQRLKRAMRRLVERDLIHSVQWGSKSKDKWRIERKPLEVVR